MEPGAAVGSPPAFGKPGTRERTEQDYQTARHSSLHKKFVKGKEGIVSLSTQETGSQTDPAMVSARQKALAKKECSGSDGVCA